LAANAKKYKDNVRVIQTRINKTKYQPRKLEESKRVRIGWIGRSISQYHFEKFDSVLEVIIRKFDVEVLVISDRKPEFKNVSCRWVY